LKSRPALLKDSVTLPVYAISCAETGCLLPF